jgi:hypothetical protein
MFMYIVPARTCVIATQIICVNKMNVLPKSLIITVLSSLIMIIILALYQHFNDQPIYETHTHDVVHSCVTMPLQTLDDGETDEFGDVLNSRYQSSVV